jgi:hypothetical protein
MKRNIVIVTLSLLTIVMFLSFKGCTAYEVSDDNKADVKGIPFYIKKGQVKQVTTYTRSWIEATINYYRIDGNKKIDGSERTASIAISELTYDQIRLLGDFEATINSAKKGFATAIVEFHSLLEQSCNDKKNCEISPQMIAEEASSNLSTPNLLLQAMESNSSSYDAIVDYSKLYYFNALVPAFGTTTASTKLASDGTLTEVTSSVDSSKLAELIPLKEILIDRWGLEEIAVALKKKEKPVQRDYVMTLSISINGYKYSLTKYHEYKIGLNLPPLSFDTDNISVNRVRFGSEIKSESEKKENAISIEGSITLPENK